MENNLMANIHPQTFERDFYYNDTNMLITNINNFQVYIPTSIFAENNINTSINQKSNGFLNFSKNTMFKDALSEYKQSLVDGYPFRQYGSALTYQITYNDNCHLSTYYDTYTYTGGAHGSTVRESSTYSLKTGKELPVEKFFTSVAYKKLILEEILSQARKNQQENEGLYFDDYEALIAKNLNLKNYYLTKDGVVFYFQQYDIAPYVTGIVEFLIPYDVTGAPPKC